MSLFQRTVAILVQNDFLTVKPIDNTYGMHRPD